MAVHQGDRMRLHIRNATSLGLAISGALAALSLAACGGQSDVQFNASFDKSTHDSCVTTASQHLPAADAETYCTCVVKQLDQYSVADKMALPMHQEKLQAAANVCNAQLSSGTPAASNTTP
jgi:hypothetical protein